MESGTTEILDERKANVEQIIGLEEKTKQKSRVLKIDFKWCTIPYAMLATNICPILPMNFTYTNFYWVYVIQNAPGSNISWSLLGFVKNQEYKLAKNQ